MKVHFDQHLPAALLISYSIVSCFSKIPTSPIILFSFAALYGFNQFLLRQEIKRNNLQDLELMKQEFADQVRATDEKLKQLQLEVSQVSMSMGIRPGSAAAPKREQIKVNF